MCAGVIFFLNKCTVCVTSGVQSRVYYNASVEAWELRWIATSTRTVSSHDGAATFHLAVYK